jgi:hypothetical protein
MPSHGSPHNNDERSLPVQGLGSLPLSLSIIFLYPDCTLTSPPRYHWRPRAALALEEAYCRGREETEPSLTYGPHDHFLNKIVPH